MSDELAQLRRENADLRRQVEDLRSKLRRRPSLTDGYYSGAMRCPFANVPGEKACSYHSYSGCSWKRVA